MLRLPLASCRPVWRSGLLAASTSSTSRSARMTTTAVPKKHLFLVYLPDKTDPEALQRRLSVREQHLANAKKLHAQGVVKFGGAMVTEESLTATKKDMKGSTLFMYAENSSEIRKLIEADVYYTSNVWDPEQIIISPFVEAPLT